MDSNTVVTSFCPHNKAKNSTWKIMLVIILALMVPFGFGIYAFGPSVVTITLASVFSCLFTEIAFNIIQKENTVKDLSAVVTGLILALILPPTVPLYVPIIGGVFAIALVKKVFGGIGKNIVNPAAAARVFLGLAFKNEMLGNIWVSQNFISEATPLSNINQGIKSIQSTLDLLLGFKSGSIGELCVLALLIIGVVLALIKIIDYIVPLAMLAGAAIVAAIFAPDMTLYHLLSGGLIFGAVFMVTDYTTSPRTLIGKIIFGFGVGALSIMVRLWGSYPEGVSMAIIFMNLFVPLLDKIEIRRTFGNFRAKKPKAVKSEKK